MGETKTIRVFLLAGYLPSYEVIESLITGEVNLVGVLFSPEQPKRLGWRQRIKNILKHRSLREPAFLLKKQNIPAHFCPTFNGTEAEQILKAAKPDVLLLYGTKIIKPNILDIPSIGTLNAHSALLPKYRGGASEFWILLNGETECAGVTIHWVTPGLDEGEIFLQKALKVEEGETPVSLREKSRPLAGKLYVDAIRSIERGEIVRIPQDERLASKYKWPTPEEIQRFKEKYAAISNSKSG